MVYINGQSKSTTIHDSSKPKEPIGTYHLSANSSIYEPIRTNNFMFTVSLKSDLSKAFQTSGTIKAATAEEAIRIAVSGAFTPSYSQKKLEVKRGNTTLYYAGVMEVANDKTLKLHDYIGADTLSALYAWQSESGDLRTEKVGLASDYKKEAYIQEYTPDYQLVRRWHLYGCWIMEISTTGGTEENKLSEISAKICYDKFVLEYE